MKKQIGYVGLGKMGMSMVLRLKDAKWDVRAYDIIQEARNTAKRKKVAIAKDLRDLVGQLPTPRIIWLMVPSRAEKGEKNPVDQILQEIMPYLSKGDIVIDGGNSLYEETARRAEYLARSGVEFMDTGVSGGPGTVREGKPAIMVGGNKKVFEKLRFLFYDLTQKESIGYMGPAGSGHFVKMIHNGIEYGYMQALAEGFTLLKRAPFELDLQEVARVYSNGSVIESRLTKWLQSGLKKYGEELEEVSGSVGHTGEGEWTVKTGKKFHIPLPVIKAALLFRAQSAKHPSYTGKILSMLRSEFGGHKVSN
ncbi:MAG: 6-phosphogluconate dehydrogenase (decarboxylating) [Candidatus Wildermuthbacteria bacterium RIFCSPHIGHO2_12_FULL_45_9]|uniref:6-phosphogluconate dehydrogenase (Decarboxylating) n=1 Tax=Candidatus Wildermuthbacteria bacterium RIFCSPHIGHO2_02_FULL_45_25 TaxID=1802450 RepID=A0A1G2R3W4_9BACT|nr:MAG: 6-phosphogluconate dehydrogenase (decarboxylating) [Candidatus Wildermuthbacteria bacterium RIFCSPHIGHO2_01_FULL_45_20]OHA67503.1 MAG: 6-phosphogluconate dehydrogenase (decarboxylating) [Candidatus Wildermuthbacteria bacterium RIFCSPHIGHO2_02_FULL_45_25]OHA72120.1 MAG: 6-phosphogluconate dehydrogenase (decarboxylating) [Candidatus Wildermuthbacteria bacterium RIFCSPHIGHO2_12_FULL_45_9]